MKLPLNPAVLGQHVQKYAKSCVPMAVELVLKLMGEVNIDYYELQDENGDDNLFVSQHTIKPQVSSSSVIFKLRKKLE